MKEGDLQLLTPVQHSGSAFKKTFSSIRRTANQIATLFAFNDVLIIAKKSRYALLSLIQML